MAISLPLWGWAISALGGPQGVTDWLSRWALDDDAEKHI